MLSSSESKLPPGMPAAPCSGNVESDPQVAHLLDEIGLLVITAERASGPTRRRRTISRPLVVGATMVALVGGTAAAAASEGFGLLSGYAGTDELIDTTSWRSDWEARIEDYRWPRGFSGNSYVDGQVHIGAARPDAVPASDLDREVLMLNACAWTASYEKGFVHGDGPAQREALDALEVSLHDAPTEIQRSDAQYLQLKSFVSEASRVPTDAGTILVDICDSQLVRAAIGNVQ